MSDDARQLRNRQAGLRRDVGRATTPDPPPGLDAVFELVKVGASWPFSGTNVYKAIAVELSGPDVPGADVTVTRLGTEPAQLVNLGNGTPPDPTLGLPTYVLATMVSGQLLFHYSTH